MLKINWDEYREKGKIDKQFNLKIAKEILHVAQEDEVNMGPIFNDDILTGAFNKGLLTAILMIMYSDDLRDEIFARSISTRAKKESNESEV